MADLALAGQNILLILEDENLDWMPSPSLESAMAARLQAVDGVKREEAVSA